MTNDFAKRVESWNKQYKPCHRGSDSQQQSTPSQPVQIHEERDCQSQAAESENGGQPKKTFSQIVYEWNRHYKVGNTEVSKHNTRLHNSAQSSQDCSAHDTTTTSECDGEDNYEQVSIAQKIREWDRHYKTRNRNTCDIPIRNQQSSELDHGNQNNNLNSEQISNKVGLWEQYYHPTKREKGVEMEKENCNHHQTTAPKFKALQITRLVSQWNQRYGSVSTSSQTSRHSEMTTPNSTQQSEKPKAPSNVLTSQLVKHWNYCYSVKHNKENSPPVGTVVEKKDKRLRNKVSRKPSLVKARIEELATQSAADTVPRYKHQQQAQEISRFTCRSNFAEIRSRFAVNCYRC